MSFFGHAVRSINNAASRISSSGVPGLSGAVNAATIIESSRTGSFSPFNPFNAVPDAMKPKKDQGSFNAGVGQGLQEAKNNAPAPPNRDSAISFANQNINNDLARRRAASTLFTGGQGVLDSPLVASALLVGS